MVEMLYVVTLLVIIGSDYLSNAIVCVCVHVHICGVCVCLHIVIDHLL